MITYILLGLVAVIAIASFFKRNNGNNGSYTNVSIQDLKQFAKDKNTVLIDVRTPREISQGVIGNPLKIELGASMQNKFEDLDRDKKYILYCRSGKRSAMASKVMSKMGFKDVNNLLGGYLAWKSAK